MKFVLVTNIPAPYRVPIFNKVAEEYGDDFIVIFSAKTESNRQWDFDDIKFRHIFLKENYSDKNGVYVHNNVDVLNVINKIKPDVIITSGFNPTSIYSWFYSVLSGTPHVSFTDGWSVSERNLGVLHRLCRKLVYKTSKAFIGASKNSLELYKYYGVKKENLFISHLCINNKFFLEFADNKDRPYDVMFSGQIIERKIPDFFVEVVKRLLVIRGKLSVLIIGNGSSREKLLNSIQDAGADLFYPGFIPQNDLPKYYSKAKILLFTTINDPWGIVANEALACGTPVITTPYAGVINDLVIDGYNGFIREVDADAWAYKVNEILDDDCFLIRLRENAKKSIEEFNFDNAARGIMEAFRWAVKKNIC